MTFFNIIYANFHIGLFNTLTQFPESGPRKHFHASGMRAIDSPHKITRKKSLFERKNFSTEIDPRLSPPFKNFKTC